MGAEMDLNGKSCATGCPAILYIVNFQHSTIFKIFTLFKDQKLWAKSPPKSLRCGVNVFHQCSALYGYQKTEIQT